MQQTVVKTYTGSQEQATSKYRADAAKMAMQGYVPTNQVWSAGSYGCGSFLFALLLCLVLIGILVFIYMLIVKPAGTLTVTYTLAPRAELEKTCPKCAERVKAAAAICRFCGHTFEALASAPAPASPVNPSPPPSGAEAFGMKLGSLFAKKPPRK
jgi:hypothetical protein